jgi:hypothetical protein
VRKNHEIIGLIPEFDVISWNKRCLKQFDPDHYLMTNYAKEFAAVIHMGFISPDSVMSEISIGIDWILDYFQTNKISNLTGGWFYHFSYGILLCLLTKRYSDLRSLCGWAKSNRKPDLNRFLINEIQQLYLILASQFHEKAGKGFKMLLTKIQKSKKREVKMHVAALTAVVERDQEAFESSVRKYVEFHSKKVKPSPTAVFMEDWITHSHEHNLSLWTCFRS